MLETAAQLLADGVIAALPGWVERCVASACEQAGVSATCLTDQTRVAGKLCVAEMAPALRDLLATDVAQQQTTPLGVLRSAVRFPTQVLVDGAVPTPRRDQFEAARFPDDLYGLIPASLSDLDPQLGPIGLAWGAAKALALQQ